MLTAISCMPSGVAKCFGDGVPYYATRHEISLRFAGKRLMRKNESGLLDERRCPFFLFAPSYIYRREQCFSVKEASPFSLQRPLTSHQGQSQVSAKMNNLPPADENELHVEAFGIYIPAETPEFWSERCHLTLLSSFEGFSKCCSADDVDERQQRFLIPAANATRVLKHIPAGQHPRSGIPIRVYLVDGTYYPLLFKERCDGKYVIKQRAPSEITRWSHVCAKMGLQRRDHVRMWFYKHRGSDELCICIAKEV